LRAQARDESAGQRPNRARRPRVARGGRRQTVANAGGPPTALA